MEKEYDFSTIDATKGLPEELFLNISSLMPVPNVDLFITNEKGQLLLAWRDDSYFGTGWHLPGGCIRFRETMIERVHKTAINELGFDVSVEENPIAVKDVIVESYRKGLLNQDIRAHQVAILFKCYKGTDELTENNGNYRWFDEIPENILKVHDAYEDIFREYGLVNNEKTIS